MEIRRWATCVVVVLYRSRSRTIMNASDRDLALASAVWSCVRSSIAMSTSSSPVDLASWVSGSSVGVIPSGVWNTEILSM